MMNTIFITATNNPSRSLSLPLLSNKKIIAAFFKISRGSGLFEHDVDDFLFLVASRDGDASNVADFFFFDQRD